MLFTYQKRISFGLCLLFIYYYAFPFFESYQLGPSRSIKHASSTFHINYLPLYIVTMWEHSKLTMEYYSNEWILQNAYTFEGYSFLISICISFYLIIELSFYCRWKYLESHINANKSVLDVAPSISNERRDHILKMAAKYATLYDEGVIGWACLWFKGCQFKQLCYDNVMEFLSWAFFLNHYEGNKKTAKEVRWRTDFGKFAMKCIENITERKLKPGYNPNVSFVHNTNDDIPLSTTYRSFIFYIALFIGQCVTDFIFLYILRFEYRYVNGLKVWHKIQSNKTENIKKSKPILLVHGLGVHYMPYIPLIYKLYTKSLEHDIFCIEIPWTAMSIWHFIPKSLWSIFSNQPSPSYIDSKLPATKQDFIEILQKMETLILSDSANTKNQLLFQKNIDNPLQLKWTLIGHSYGSFIISGIYHYIKHNASRCNDQTINLPRLVLLDPVTMCLSQPTTVSFLVLKAQDWITWTLQHLAAKELMIACTLRKYFHWFEYVIFPEDLINEQVEHIVITASNDTLIPGELIRKGIENVNHKQSEQAQYKRIHHISFDRMHHAVWLAVPSCIQQIVDMI